MHMGSYVVVSPVPVALNVFGKRRGYKTDIIVKCVHPGFHKWRTDRLGDWVSVGVDRNVVYRSIYWRNGVDVSTRIWAAA